VNRPALVRISAIAVLLLALLAPLTQPAEAQNQNLVTENVLSTASGRTWKGHLDGIEQGAAWRDLNYDDSAWEDVTTRFYDAHGLVRGDGYYAYYFREEIEITDVHQISELHLDLYYDDAAVLYLNGEEVYRSIRNNLPATDVVPVGAVMPVDTLVSVGGAEDYYVQIPATSNYCEQGCINDGAADPVDAGLLKEGINVFAAMVWTRPTSDLGFDLGIDVVRDLDTPLPDQILLNEVVASNDTVQDEDGSTPDWFELYNPGGEAVTLQGWTIEDAASSWNIPTVTIGAGEHLRIFASGKDRTGGANLHTNFKLSKEDDALRLIDANNIVRDSWEALPRQITDVAWGRVNDGNTITYLAQTTPGAPNTGPSDQLAPIIRPFSNRLFNVNDAIDLQIDAFDPDGGPLTFSMPNNQNVTVDGANGSILGTASTIGEFAYVVTVADQEDLTTSQVVRFTVVEEATPGASLVLNEYNAVAPSRELSAGGDAVLGNQLGNGGDWYEFLVVEDLLDLRGWTLQLWDRDRADDIVDRAASLTFANDLLLGALPAGTVITISEDRPDDLSFDPANGDWTLHLQANELLPGSMFAVQENFNSTRSDQQVEIRDADGVLRSPIVGETEAWDAANGGVSGGEVMNLCSNPTAAVAVDPSTDYADNAVSSTYGLPNVCVYADPADPTGATIVNFAQDLSALRNASGLRGDVNCDGFRDVLDSLMIAQHDAFIRDDAGSCQFGDPSSEVYAQAGDFNLDGYTDVVDAMLIAQCDAFVINAYC